MPLNGEEKKAWHEWYTNPRGTDEHLTSIGSRSRPVSYFDDLIDPWRSRRDKESRAKKRCELDGLIELMVKRGVLARDEAETASQISSRAKGVSRKKR